MKHLFFNPRQPRRFSYQPVFYNEAKERRIERERRAREELGLPPIEGDENRTAEQRLRGKFSSFRKYDDKNIEFTRRATRFSHLRIIIFATILFGLIYFFMKGAGLEKLLGFLMSSN